MILVECKPDAVLVKSLAARGRNKDIVHEIKGKFEVCRRLSALEHTVGLVDEDPSARQPVYLSRMSLTDDFQEHGLMVLYHKRRDNRLIILRPKLEDWALKVAKSAKLDVTEYGLPGSPKRMHEHINARLDEFQALVRDLRRRSDSMKALARLLRVSQ